MLSPLRNRFGIPGVISVIALVFAMLGGAYAATNSGGGKATASAKGKPGPRGPRGKTGPVGPAGPAGPQGSAGANGKDGSNGSNGTNGKDGQSVTGTPIATGGDCGSSTGVKYTLGASSTNVCNGEEGEPGESPEGVEFTKADEEAGTPPGEPCGLAGGIEYEVESVENSTKFVCNGTDGSPWTVGGTLPKGATETGTWSFNGSATDFSGVWAPISFPVRLPSSLEGSKVHFVGNFGDGVTCTGAVSAPTAPEGELCVYRGEALSGATFGGIYGPNFVNKGAGISGALIFFEGISDEAFDYGSWAVTSAG